MVRSFPTMELIQTSFEADAYMAHLAGSEGVALLSNDSDFFVQTSVTLIPISSLFHHVSEGDRPFLHCRDGRGGVPGADV